MTRSLGALIPSATIFAAVLLADGCNPPVVVNKDGGADSGITDCVFAEDCPVGFCKDSKCVTCPETPCDQGYICNAAGKCVRCTTNCDAGQVGKDGGCATKFDCPNGQVCASTSCGQPPVNCGNHDECPAGKACRVPNCVDGCTADRECVTNNNGKKCETTKNECGCVSAATDCNTSDVCFQGKCLTPTSCDAGCGAFPCIGGRCVPCQNAGECGGAGWACTNGQCIRQGCAPDGGECTAISPGHWCNVNTGQCEWGCLPGTSPACGQNCCNPPSTCNTATHQCQVPQQDGGPRPDGGGIGDGGGLLEPCVIDLANFVCGCGPDLECFPALVCLFTGGICVPTEGDGGP